MSKRYMLNNRMQGPSFSCSTVGSWWGPVLEVNSEVSKYLRRATGSASVHFNGTELSNIALLTEVWCFGSGEGCRTGCQDWSSWLAASDRSCLRRSSEGYASSVSRTSPVRQDRLVILSYRTRPGHARCVSLWGPPETRSAGPYSFIIGGHVQKRVQKEADLRTV